MSQHHLIRLQENVNTILNDKEDEKVNIFTEIKSAVSLEEAASFYGIEFNHRNKMCNCLFHNDKHPSMKLNKDYYYCFSCGAHGDVINMVQQLYNLSAIDAANKIISDFKLNVQAEISRNPSIITQKQKEIEYRKDLERAFAASRRDALFVLHEYHGLLLKWKRELAPEDMNLDNANPLFLEALNNFDRIDAMIDELTYGTMQEQIDFVKSFNKEVEKIEKRINEFKSSGC